MNFKRQIDLPYPQPWEYIHSLIGDKTGGVFVDVGAYDGVTVTNTQFFEDVLGWSGLCIEPNPNAFSNLVNRRTSKCYNFGISDIEGSLNFRKVNGYAEMLSGFVDFFSSDHIKRINYEVESNGDSFEDIKIQTKRLDSVLLENNISIIDYLSIDTEGHEFQVLNSINFDECVINFISVENNNDNQIRNFLNSKGFDYLNTICGDDIYKKR